MLEFALILGDDEFAAVIDGKVFEPAIFFKGPVSLDGELGLKTIGGVIKSGVQDTAVAA